MRTITITTMFFALVLQCSWAPAQRFLSYDSAVAQFGQSNALSALSPAGGAVRVLAAPPLAATASPLGGVSVDNSTGMIYATDGITGISQLRFPYLAPLGSAPGPLLPLPAALGPVTGIAVAPAAGLLWLTDGANIIAVNLAAPGGPPVLGPWASPSPVPLTGLDWNPVAGNLLAVDQNSQVFELGPGGAVLAAYAPVAYVPPGPAVGVAVDKSQAALQIYVAYAGGLAVEHLGGVFVPLALPNAQGLSFIADPVRASAGVVCPGSGPLRTYPSTLVYTGSAGFELILGNGPPLTTVVLGISLTAAAPPIAVGGSLLWLDPLTLIGTVSLTTDLAGEALIPAPLVGLPLGTQAYVQWAVPCPALPAGLVLSPAMQLRVAVP